MPRPPDYKIIYNWDGAPHGYSRYPQTMEQFLDKVYAVMRDTQVGAHFWSLGGSEFGRWRSGEVAPRQPGAYRAPAASSAPRTSSACTSGVKTRTRP